MNDEERMDELERKIELIKARVDDIFEAVKFLSSSTTENLNRINEDITEVHEYLLPTVRKVFPRIASGYDEIHAVLRRHPRPGAKGK